MKGFSRRGTQITGVRRRLFSSVTPLHTVLPIHGIDPAKLFDLK
jgi:hypothetical protein